MMTMMMTNETRVINPNSLSGETGLQDTQTIRVYHGFNSVDDACVAAQHGLSGGEKARRTYSYEANNNPKGLFVTIDFNMAKKFTKTDGVIMEFQTQVSNLEAPIWPGGGSYAVQGQKSGTFADDQEREDQRLKNREAERTGSDHQGVRDSDRPELASTLFDNSEKQALFVGDLNANMIRRFWVKTDGTTYVPMTRQEFVRKVAMGRKDSVGKIVQRDNRDMKVYQPNDNFGSDEKFLQQAAQAHGEGAEDYLMAALEGARQGDTSSANELRQFLYPKQFQQALAGSTALTEAYLTRFTKILNS